MTYRIAIFSTPLSQSETDLSKMIRHLVKVLSEVEGADVEDITLAPESLPDYSQYDHVVFCGYDHLTLSRIHGCLDLASPPPITLYDEPGRSLESEMKNIIFRGVDSGRIPASSLSAVEYCWSYRDILSLVTRSCRSSEIKKSPKRPGSSSRNPRTREVVDAGKAQAPERTTPDEAGDS